MVRESDGRGELDAQDLDEIAADGGQLRGGEMDDDRPLVGIAVVEDRRVCQCHIEGIVSVGDERHESGEKVLLFVGEPFDGSEDDHGRMHPLGWHPARYGERFGFTASNIEPDPHERMSLLDIFRGGVRGPG